MEQGAAGVDKKNFTRPGNGLAGLGGGLELGQHTGQSQTIDRNHFRAKDLAGLVFLMLPFLEGTQAQDGQLPTRFPASLADGPEQVAAVAAGIGILHQHDIRRRVESGQFLGGVRTQKTVIDSGRQVDLAQEGPVEQDVDDIDDQHRSSGRFQIAARAGGNTAGKGRLS